jgi:hypothetical protein
MSGLELTIITAVVFMLFALERVYASTRKRERETIECLGTVAGLLREIRDDARERNVETVGDRIKLADRLDNFEGCFASIENALSDIDRALHGDYDDPTRKTLNCLSSIEDCVGNINNRVVDISLALESDMSPRAC